MVVAYGGCKRKRRERDNERERQRREREPPLTAAAARGCRMGKRPREKERLVSRTSGRSTFFGGSLLGPTVLVSARRSSFLSVEFYDFGFCSGIRSSGQQLWFGSGSWSDDSVRFDSVKPSQLSVRVSGSGQQFGSSQPVRVSLWSGPGRLGQTESTRSNPSQLGSTPVNRRSTEVNASSEYCKMHASKSSLGNDITKSYLASFAQEYSGYSSKTRHGWNRRTMKSRVLSGRSISKRLSLFCFRCAMKIPAQSRQRSDISGCDNLSANR